VRPTEVFEQCWAWDSKGTAVKRDAPTITVERPFFKVSSFQNVAMFDLDEVPAEEPRGLLMIHIMKQNASRFNALSQVL
jgi:hypothetical protein